MPLMIARRGHRNPDHLHRPDRGADRPEQQQVDDQHQPDAFPRVAGVEVALDPVVRRALAVLGQRFLVLGLGAIELRALPEDGLDAARLRAVRVVGRLDLGVVLAVDRDPLLGHHAGREPQPEAEEVADGRGEVERTVRLGAVQEDRDAGDGDVRQRQRDDDVAPPGQRHQSVGGEGEEVEGHGGPGCGPRKGLEINQSLYPGIEPPVRRSGLRCPVTWIQRYGVRSNFPQENWT